MQLSSISLAITSLTGGLFSPQSIFTTGVNGAWYDPSDITRYMSSLGSELVPNGTFDSSTTGWSGATYGANLSATGGELVVVRTAANGRGTFAFTTVAGRAYSVTATYRKVSGTTDASVGWSNNNYGGSATWLPNNSTSSPVTKTGVFFATGTQASVSVGNDGGASGDTFAADNISVRELTDISTATLFQDAAGTTPVTAVDQPVGLMLDKSKGLVLGPELVTNGDFSNGTTGWTSNNGATLSSPSSDFRIVGNGSTGWPGAYQQVTTVAGRWYKATIQLKSSNVNATFMMRASSWNAPSSQSINVVGTTPGNYQVSFYATGTTSFIGLESTNSSPTLDATIDNISVRELPGNHAFNPSGNSANFPSGNSANFPVLQQDGTGRYYLAFNGVNQWLQTNSIDFTYGDKMFVSAGVRKLSDAATGIISELSNNGYSSNGAFYLSGPNINGIPNYGWTAGGISHPYVQPIGYSSPTTNVLSGTSNIASPELRFIVNGTQVAQSTDTQGTGNFGNYPLYIGARAGTSLWFNGRLYGLVVAGKQASASEIASTETWLNQKTGAY